MSRGRLIVACDFGTTAFRALVCEERDDGVLEVLAGHEEPAVGFQDGDFVDLAAGSRAVARALRAVEAAADVDVQAFTYNISGSHLRSVWARGQVQIGPGPRHIRAADLEAVLAKARSLVIPFDHQILAVNPVEYTVDRVKGIVDPRGRIGSQLEVEAHLITGSRSVVRNVENAIRTAGYSAAGGAVDTLAVATALLEESEKEAGVLLVDVGGGATGWAAFRHGRIVGNGSVPWGGVHMTADLAHGLRVPADEAERIKRDRGVALRSLEEAIAPEVLFAPEAPALTPALIAAILEPRLEEIVGLVKDDIGESVALAHLGAGVVLTGGGARCRGADLLVEEVLDLPVQERHLPGALAGADRLPEGQWATAAGLSLWAAGLPVSRPERADVPRPARGVLDRVRAWFGQAERSKSTERPPRSRSVAAGGS
jgi:cell division protein FtsA